VSLEQSDAQRKKLLTEAAQQLESNVLIHMKELNESTAFHFELVQQAFDVQRDIIEGQNNSNNNNSSRGGDGVRGLSLGLRQLIQRLLKDTKELIERLTAADVQYNVLLEGANAGLRLIYTNKPVCDLLLLTAMSLSHFVVVVVVVVVVVGSCRLLRFYT
jgi:hypothetical protein